MNHMRQAHMVTPLVSYFSLGPSFPTHMDTHIHTQTWSSQGQQRILGSWLGSLLPP